VAATRIRVPRFMKMRFWEGMSREEFPAMETIDFILLPERQTEERVRVQLLMEEL
jgi:hypothetical protein